MFASQVIAAQSVIQPGAQIMQIIPQDQPLVDTARIERANIDQIYTGQPTTLRFVGLDPAITPDVLARISGISADVVSDDTTGQSYYLAEILPQPGEIEKLARVDLLPGMPVDAFIQTAQRSPMAYLTGPLTRYFYRAFRG